MLSVSVFYFVQVYNSASTISCQHFFIISADSCYTVPCLREAETENVITLWPLCQAPVQRSHQPVCVLYRFFVYYNAQTSYFRNQFLYTITLSFSFAYLYRIKFPFSAIFPYRINFPFSVLFPYRIAFPNSTVFPYRIAFPFSMEFQFPFWSKLHQ